jgi:hypothetical protein
VLVDGSSLCGAARSSAITVAAQEVARVSKNRAFRRSFWVIAPRTRGRMEVLTIDAGGETVLPVFSFQEEGEFFLRLEAREADLWLRETTTGELVSLLLGLSSGVDKVALDPVPSLGEREIRGLVSTGRRHFVSHLMGEVAAHSERKTRPDSKRDAPMLLVSGRAERGSRHLPRANET